MDETLKSLHEEAEVILTFRYEPGEYARGLRRVQARGHRAVFDSAVALLLLTCGAWLWVTSGLNVWVILMCSGAIFFLAVLAFVVFAVPILIERSQAKFREPYTLSFAPEGVQFKTPSIDSQFKWSFYHSWSEDSEFLYLFHGKREVSILPLRAFANPEDQGELRRMASEHIGAQAHN